MIRRSLFLLVPVTASLLVSCQTPFDDSPAQRTRRAYVPKVSLPDARSLNADEQRFLPDAEDVLTDAGYRTTPNDGSEYELALSVSAGMVNTDAKVTLYRQEKPVAHGAARRGGAAYLLKKEQRTRDAFNAALQQFEDELPNPRAARSGSDEVTYDEAAPTSSPTMPGNSAGSQRPGYYRGDR